MQCFITELHFKFYIFLVWQTILNYEVFVQNKNKELCLCYFIFSYFFFTSHLTSIKFIIMNERMIITSAVACKMLQRQGNIFGPLLKEIKGKYSISSTSSVPKKSLIVLWNNLGRIHFFVIRYWQNTNLTELFGFPNLKPNSDILNLVEFGGPKFKRIWPNANLANQITFPCATYGPRGVYFAACLLKRMSQAYTVLHTQPNFSFLFTILQ